MSGAATGSIANALGFRLLLPSTAYGQLFLIKLVTFGAILGLARLNRFYLMPAISNSDKAIFAFRTSVVLKLAFAISVLALVAWLGIFDPNS